MQQITGRLTADATIKTLDSGKQVVKFSIVDSDKYKPKGSDEAVELSTFFNCSYWFSTNVAKILRKGAVVLLDGRLSARGYTTNTGDMGASLDFITNHIDVLSYAAKKEGATNAATTNKQEKPDEVDDLPF